MPNRAQDVNILNREYFAKLGDEHEADVRKFEEKYSRQLGQALTIGDFSLADIIRKVETVGFSDELITQKVYSQVVRGAEDDETLLNRFARVVEMESEIEVVPIITPDDIKIYPGMTGPARSMGGVFDRVKLDCSSGKGLYKGDLGFEDWWLKSNKYGAIEEALWAGGNAVYRDIITKVIVDLETDKHATMTNALANWGNNHYKTLMKMETLIEAEGMRPDFALVNPTEKYDILILDVFIDADYKEAATGGLPRVGSQFGMLHGVVPLYSHRGVTTASMTMGCRGKSAIAPTSEM